MMKMIRQLAAIACLLLPATVRAQTGLPVASPDAETPSPPRVAYFEFREVAADFTLDDVLRKSVDDVARITAGVKTTYGKIKRKDRRLAAQWAAVTYSALIKMIVRIGGMERIAESQMNLSTGRGLQDALSQGQQFIKASELRRKRNLLDEACTVVQSYKNQESVSE